MTNDKCPRCGHQRHDPVGTELLRTRHHDPMVESWYCGTYREPSGNVYESELCETRQELATMKRDSLDCIAEQTRNNEALRVRAERAEAELDKRERALEQACEWADIDLYHGELRASGHKIEGAHELAEWLRNREVKS